MTPEILNLNIFFAYFYSLDGHLEIVMAYFLIVVISLGFIYYLTKD